jgi:Domain of unknown function (DUF1905)
MEFEGEVIYWRGPAPFVFAKVPSDLSAEIKAVSSKVSYGWGVISVSVLIGQPSTKLLCFPRTASTLSQSS